MLAALRIANRRFDVLKRGATSFRIVCQSCTTTTEHGQKVEAVVSPVPMGAALSPALPPSDSQPAIEQSTPNPTKAAKGPPDTKDSNDSKGTRKRPPQKRKGTSDLVWRFEKMIDVSRQCWGKKPKVPSKIPPEQTNKAAYDKWEAESEAHKAWQKEWWIVKKRWCDCTKLTMKQEHHPVGETLRIFNRCKQGGYVDHVLLLFLVDELMKDPTAAEQFDTMRLSMAVNCLGMMARDSRDVTDLDKEAGWGKYIRKKHDDDGNPANKRTKSFFEDTCLDFVNALLDHAKKRNILPDKLNLRDCGTIAHGLGLLFPTEERDHEIVVETPGHIKRAVAIMAEKFGRDVRVEECVPINMSCMLHGCANVRNYKNIGPICDAVESSLRRGEDEFSEQQVSNITWALGKLHTGGQVLFDLLGVQIVKKAKDFIPQGLANTVYGLGVTQETGGAGIDGKVVDVLYKQVERTELRRFSRQDVNSLVYGFERLIPKDDPLLVKLHKEGVRRLRRRQHINREYNTR